MHIRFTEQARLLQTYRPVCYPCASGRALASQISGALDLNKIGVFGHSFGGAISGKLALQDARVKAGFNLDGPLYHFSHQPMQFNKPLCHAYGTDTLYGEDKISSAGITDAVLKASSAWGCSITMQGTAHMNFSDVNYVTPMKFTGLLGAVDNQQMGEQLNQLLITFFDFHLKGDNRWQHSYPDITIDAFNN